MVLGVRRACGERGARCCSSGASNAPLFGRKIGAEPALPPSASAWATRWCKRRPVAGYYLLGGIVGGPPLFFWVACETEPSGL
jgi:hypothetical protein